MRAALVLALVAIIPPATTSVPTEPDKPIDSAAALAGLEAVIAANPSVDYPAVVIDECPFGDQRELATAVEEIVTILPSVLDGEVHAWVNPDNDQPGVGCWISDEDAEGGIYWVEVYGRTLRGLQYAGLSRGDNWERADESVEPLRNSDLYTVCVTRDADWAEDERDCMAHWVDEEVGLQLELELWSNDMSATADDAAAVMTELLPRLAAALADRG